MADPRSTPIIHLSLTVSFILVLGRIAGSTLARAWGDLVTRSSARLPFRNSKTRHEPRLSG